MNMHERSEDVARATTPDPNYLFEQMAGLARIAAGAITPRHERPEDIDKPKDEGGDECK